MSIRDIEPRNVMRFFEELCAIPHGSGNTKAISDYCVAFAAQHGFEHYQDAFNNVIIIAPATAGYEDAEPFIMQGHLDMVLAQAAGNATDMTKEGLSLVVKGDDIYADGTTLGSDDGIAVAMALAVMDADDIPHPRIEAVFTVDEEVGMTGAKALDVSPLKAKKMLNIDSEVEGVFTVGCAGGARVDLRWAAQRETVNAVPVVLTVDGLSGGHSGIQIGSGRANAIILMGRLLRALSKQTSFRIETLSGGTADNAIPCCCTCTVAAAEEDVQTVMDLAGSLQETLRREFRAADKDVCVHARALRACEMNVTGKDLTGRLISALTLTPNGVQSMTQEIPGLVETSLNLGIVEVKDDVAQLSWSVRSSVGSRKAKLIDRLVCIGEVLGGEAHVYGDYPAWEYHGTSPLCDKMAEIYRRQTGKEPTIEVIHAGLECGLFAEKIPGLDCVSFGPDLIDIHTTNEHMNIPSVQRVWEFLKMVLKESK